MNPEIKAQWVAALRSGEYQQGKRYLRRQWNNEEPQYCCLGVLCDLAAKAGVVTKSVKPLGLSLKATYYGAENKDDAKVPIRAIADWAGLRHPIPSVLVEQDNGAFKDRVMLTELNDVAGYTFGQIADLIEEQL